MSARAMAKSCRRAIVSAHERAERAYISSTERSQAFETLLHHYNNERIRASIGTTLNNRAPPMGWPSAASVDRPPKTRFARFGPLGR